MKRNLILSGIILFICIVIFGVYQYNKPHKDIVSSASDFEMSADDLYSEFEKDPETASTKYANKVITFSGMIYDVQQNQNGGYNILLQGQKGIINCEVDPTINLNVENFLENTSVKVKGLCIGYDDLLQELQFKKCSIVE